MQQPIHKVVGRQATASQRFAQLEDLTDFVKKHAHGSLAKSEGDYFQFEKLLVALAADKVDYAVVGGLAIILNGYPRLTLDADILVQHTHERQIAR